MGFGLGGRRVEAEVVFVGLSFVCCLGLWGLGCADGGGGGVLVVRWVCVCVVVRWACGDGDGSGAE